MVALTFEDPYVFVDSFKDKYKFHIFTDVKGSKHLSVTVSFLDSKKTIPIFGHEVAQTGFALPIDGDSIRWDAYDGIVGAGPRGNCMSLEARNRVTKLIKLKAFL